MSSLFVALFFHNAYINFYTSYTYVLFLIEIFIIKLKLETSVKNNVRLIGITFLPPNWKIGHSDMGINYARMVLPNKN